MTGWLRSLGPQRLAAMLAARPETMLPPVPRTIAELASRLRSPYGIIDALQRLPLPAVQVMRAVSEAHPNDLAALADALGVDDRDADLAATLAGLAGQAMLWEWDGRLGTTGELALPVLPRLDPVIGPRGRQTRGVPWTPRPPMAATVPVDEGSLAAETSAAASAAVDAAGAVLGCVPVTLLKTGGVGARELRRLAKQTGQEATAVRLWLEIGYEAGLLDCDDDGRLLLATEAYDDWTRQDPAGRFVALVEAWYGLPGCPTQAAGAALVTDPWGAAVTELRAELIDILAAPPAGNAFADPVGHLTTALFWRRPLLCQVLPDAEPGADPFDGPRALVAATLTEAGRLGVLALGAPTPICRALPGTAQDREVDELIEAAAGLMAPATDTAIFQADLTAIVPGTPGAALAELLDAVADREARGSASTWRFTPSSVRRALDTGWVPADLVERLRTAAAGGMLPQPLEYLIADTGRRHGEVRVDQVASVLTGDETLVAELLANRALGRLKLRRLAPTVLASARAVQETLEALRSAGYAPVGRAADGQPLLCSSRPHRLPAPAGRDRVTPPLPRGSAGVPKPASDPVALAARLLAAPDTTPSPESPADRLIGGWTHQLDPGERHLLSYAIDSGSPVMIHYTDANGRRTARVIEPMELSGGMLVAWCQLRDDERMFALDRIEAVAPA